MESFFKQMAEKDLDEASVATSCPPNKAMKTQGSLIQDESA